MTIHKGESAMVYDGRVFEDDLDGHVYSLLVGDGLVACDIETSGLDFTSDEIGTVQLSSRSVGSLVVQVGPAPPVKLRALMEDAAVTKVFHHASFDIRFLISKWWVAPRNVADTKIASKLLEPSADPRRHSLKPLLLTYLGIEIDKAQQVSDWTASDLTAEQVIYALNDVRHLLSLYEALRHQVDRNGLGDIYESCLEFLPVRAMLDVSGVTDVFLY